MNCRDVQNGREAYEAGRLSPAESEAWAAHVDRCESCSEGLRDFESLLAGLPEEAFDLEEAIMKRVHEQASPSRRPAWLALFMRPAFAAGVCAGLVMLFILSTFLRTPSVEIARDGTVPGGAERLVLADSRLVLREGSVLLNGRRIVADDPGSEAIALRDGDRVLIEDGARGALELGVAVLALRPKLDFTVHPDRLALKRGKTVVHLRRQGNEFKVTTPLLICAVRGTTFSVSHDDEGGSSVSLAESAGEVTVSFGEGFRMTLGDGETVGVSPEGETSTAPMTEGELRETVEGAAEATGEPVQQLSARIVKALAGAGKTTGLVIDFFQRLADGITGAAPTPTVAPSTTGSGSGSADMWRSR